MNAGMDGLQPTAGSQPQTTVQSELTRIWNGLCCDLKDADVRRGNLASQIAQLNAEQKEILVKRAANAAAAWDAIKATTDRNRGVGLELELISSGSSSPSSLEARPADLRFSDIPLNNLAVFAATDSTLQTLLLGQVTDHQLYSFLRQRKLENWKLGDERAVSAVLMALDALSLTGERYGMISLANLVVNSTAPETRQMTQDYLSRSGPYASDELTVALIYISALRQDIPFEALKNGTSELTTARKSLLLKELTWADEWGSISDAEKLNHLAGWMSSTDGISETERMRIFRILGEGRGPTALRELCLPIIARQEAKRIEADLEVLRRRASDLEHNIEVELQLEPGQILSMDGLEEGIENIIARVTYNSGRPQFTVHETRKEGWGAEYMREATQKPSEPFTIEMKASTAWNELSDYSNGLRFVRPSSDLFQLSPTAKEFRCVLKVGYTDTYRGHTNLPNISIPWYHNPDSYKNGICLHANYDRRPALEELGTRGKFEVFEKALEAYFYVKGYKVQKVSLQELHQEQIRAVRDEIIALETRARSL